MKILSTITAIIVMAISLNASAGGFYGNQGTDHTQMVIDSLYQKRIDGNNQHQYYQPVQQPQY